MSEATSTQDATSLTSRVGRGLGWSMVNNVLARLGSLVAGIVLARILVPADYGAFAIALVVLNAGLSMNELGVSLAVVRWPEPVSRIAPTVATLALGWSASLYLLCFLAAPTVAQAMGSPTATPLIRVLALGILVDASVAAPAAMITRHFLQGRRTVIDLTGFVSGTAVSVPLALAGFGAWAMVWGFLVTAIVTGAMTLLLAPQRFTLGFDLEVARELLAFGAPLAGASLLMFLMLNIDNVVVGNQLGATALGFYLIAFNLCTWPVNLISTAVRRVSFAGFSRVSHDAAQSGRAFADAAGLLLGVTVPICALLAGYAAPLITALYGERWLPAAEVLQLLCILGAARIFLELAYDYLAAIGRTGANLWLQFVWLVLLAPALIAGARWGGLRGIAAAHAVVAALVVAPLFLAVLGRHGVPFGRLGRHSMWAALAGALVLGSAALVSQHLSNEWLVVVGGGFLSTLLATVAVLPLRRILRSSRVASQASAGSA